MSDIIESIVKLSEAVGGTVTRSRATIRIHIPNSVAVAIYSPVDFQPTQNNYHVNDTINLTIPFGQGNAPLPLQPTVGFHSKTAHVTVPFPGLKDLDKGFALLDAIDNHGMSANNLFVESLPILVNLAQFDNNGVAWLQALTVFTTDTHAIYFRAYNLGVGPAYAGMSPLIQIN